MMETIHNPDRFMSDLRQILSQGRKRIGLLLGAGAPASVRVDSTGRLDENGRALIPVIGRLTDLVIEKLDHTSQTVVDRLAKELQEESGDRPFIEAILSRIRLLAKAVGSSRVYGYDGAGYQSLGEQICKAIGEEVGVELPIEPNPYTELIAWVGGTNRDHAVEIFTPNYDLLLEQAFERATRPYYDGFVGGLTPFFDPASVANDELPPRWSRLWKLHGSLGWAIEGESVVRGKGRDATQLIYPDHLKYDQIQRLPYSAYFDRLRQFLLTQDSLLICCGFSFSDAHISSVLKEALASNPAAAVFAFQFGALAGHGLAAKLARNRPNISLYAKDGAIIRGIQGEWRLGVPPTKDWEEIRQTFWASGVPGEDPSFLLGDFAKLARFFALAQASELASLEVRDRAVPIGTGSAVESEELG